MKQLSKAFRFGLDFASSKYEQEFSPTLEPVYGTVHEEQDNLSNDDIHPYEWTWNISKENSIH